MNIFDIAPVKYIDNKMLVLDQTRLPGEEVYEEMHTKEDVWEAIYKLKVRGAPAIGVAAGYGLYLSIRDFPEQNANPEQSTDTEQCVGKEQSADKEQNSLEAFGKALKEAKDYLVTARPTAVNLAWALNRMWNCYCNFVNGNSDSSDDNITVANAKKRLFAEAEAIREEDEQACYNMGINGLSLLKPGMGILTHCNAGTIATAKYGTCLAPIYLGAKKGYNFRVFADETRPLLQGARLTSWELHKSGIDVTLICDNMASIVMKNGWIDAVVVGCDRMAANGDGANKIGTSGVAILAKEYGIPFYMYVPTSTIDLNTPTGDDIHIELREGEEIYKMWYEKPMAPEGVKTYNPSFDVTPAKYITAVVTEKGIVYPPYEENLARLFEEK